MNIHGKTIRYTIMGTIACLILLLGAMAKLRTDWITATMRTFYAVQRIDSEIIRTYKNNKKIPSANDPELDAITSRHSGSFHYIPVDDHRAIIIGVIKGDKILQETQNIADEIKAKKNDLSYEECQKLIWVNRSKRPWNIIIYSDYAKGKGVYASI